MRHPPVNHIHPMPPWSCVNHRRVGHLGQLKVQDGPKVTNSKHGEITPLIIRGCFKKNSYPLNVSEIDRGPFMPPCIRIGLGPILHYPCFHIQMALLWRKRSSWRDAYSPLFSMILERKEKLKKNIHPPQIWNNFLSENLPGCWNLRNICLSF